MTLLLKGIVLLAVFAAVQAVNTKMQEVFAWTQIDFEYPDETSRKEAIESGEFIPSHNLVLGLERWEDKLFLTVPRWKKGVASSLNYVKLNSGEKSPKLIPYPDWQTNKLPADESDDATHIISPFRVRADQCDRLWVMDTGMADLQGDTEAYDIPKILVYDLKTDALLRAYPLKESDFTDDSFFANIVVDVTKDNCDNAYAYISDSGDAAMVVYSWKDDDSWRINHHFFHFEPTLGNYYVGGVNFQWSDGIFGIALSSPKEDGYRALYFHPLSSNREFVVSARVVQNKTIADSYYEYKELGSKGDQSQSTASFLDETSGVLFYTQVNKDAIGCWNSKKEFTPENQGIVTQDSETFVFPNDLKLDREGNLWVLTDKLPLYIYHHLNENEINFRIFMAPVKDAIKDTVCE